MASHDAVAMAPSDKTMSGAIRAAVRRMFNGQDRDKLTVNNIREQVESELHLDAGFFKQGSWKQESKNLVKAENDKLLQLEEAGEKLPSVQSTPAKAKAAPAKVKSAPPQKPTQEPVKKGVKRSSNGDKTQGQKRQRKEVTPVSEIEDEDSALTSVEDTSEDAKDSYLGNVLEKKKAKTTAFKPTAKGLGKQKINEGKEKKKQEAGVGERLHTPDSKSAKKTPAGKTTQEDAVDGLGKKSSGDSGVKGKTAAIGRAEVELQSDSDMSVVLDEAPKQKKRSKSSSKGQSSTSTSKASKPSKATKPPPDLSPDEAEVKTLQSQLAMCGVRKIWGVVLKDYGSDIKAKIRHLKGMLKDVGMDSRFSKQKAEEIKEARELQADLEAVKEGEAIWGMGRGGRSKKVSGGNKRIEQSEDEEEGVAARSRSVSEKPPARLARAKMDLAFLGDESESDD